MLFLLWPITELMASKKIALLCSDEECKHIRNDSFNTSHTLYTGPYSGHSYLAIP